MKRILTPDFYSIDLIFLFLNRNREFIISQIDPSIPLLCQFPIYEVTYWLTVIASASGMFMSRGKDAR